GYRRAFVGNAKRALEPRFSAQQQLSPARQRNHVANAKKVRLPAGRFTLARNEMRLFRDLQRANPVLEAAERFPNGRELGREVRLSAEEQAGPPHRVELALLAFMH